MWAVANKGCFALAFPCPLHDHRRQQEKSRHSNSRSEHSKVLVTGWQENVQVRAAPGHAVGTRSRTVGPVRVKAPATNIHC
jgi:hypothetical protein